jgi:hypothetical protein
MYKNYYYHCTSYCLINQTITSATTTTTSITTATITTTTTITTNTTTTAATTTTTHGKSVCKTWTVHVELVTARLNFRSGS